jgi:hypothetical protein
MRNLFSRFRLGALSITLLLLAAVGVQANDDEWWGGYWRMSPDYNRPHPLRYSPSERTLYYGHAPPRTNDRDNGSDATGRSYDRYGNEYDRGPHIGNYHPFYGPGHYYGPAIDPYYAPGRVRYGMRKYGWW